MPLRAAFRIPDKLQAFGRLLKGALLTNPHDPVSMSRSLSQALMMSREERADRQRSLFEIVSHYDIARWGQDFLAGVAGAR